MIIRMQVSTIVAAAGYPLILPAEALVGEEGHRVGQPPVHPDFVVEMRARRAAGGSDVADHVAALDVLVGA